MEPLISEEYWFPLDEMLPALKDEEKIGAVHEICEIWNELVKRDCLGSFEFRPKSFFYQFGKYLDCDVNIKAIDFGMYAPSDQEPMTLQTRKQQFFLTLLSVFMDEEVSEQQLDLMSRPRDESLYNRLLDSSRNPPATMEKKMERAISLAQFKNPEYRKVMERCLNNVVNNPKTKIIDINDLIGHELASQYMHSAMATIVEEAKKARTSTLEKLIDGLERKWPDYPLLTVLKSNLKYFRQK